MRESASLSNTYTDKKPKPGIGVPLPISGPTKPEPEEAVVLNPDAAPPRPAYPNGKPN